MPLQYPIVVIDPQNQVSPEWMGSKPKKWVLHDGDHWLFKEAREGTGEDWSEKIAAEVGALLNISVAQVELAEMEGKRGSISKNFVNRDIGEILWHGNEILAGQIRDYDKEKRFGCGEHNLKNIRVALERLLQPTPRDIVDRMWSDLACYFTLDALITNTDRHHENWGFLWVTERDQNNLITLKLRIAPSFDHASSLGRELRDEARTRKMNEDAIVNYINRAHGAVFITGKERRGPSPMELAQFSAHKYPEIFRDIIQKIRDIDFENISAIVEKVPDERMSPISRQFAIEMLRENRELLGRIAI